MWLAPVLLRVTTANPGGNRYPIVSIVAPAEADRVYGRLTVWATAEDPDGSVVRVRFLMPDASSVEDTTAPYSASWDTRLQPNGARRIWAMATDNSGAATTTSVL
ncbi:MAG TPA: Ig-like domain-containing protein, partial [Kofleriaceae bacterium]|nr:Ig-like domain-containing protein [Kofleriaceae bacterium]